MPSMRGEDHDYRHLNQFFHCEAEMVGDLKDVRKMVEDLIRDLAVAVSRMPDIVRCLSSNAKVSMQVARALSKSMSFTGLSFDEAVERLRKNDLDHCLKESKNGIDITSEGEGRLLGLFGDKSPVWLHHYYRDRVPFYQRPDPTNEDRVLNADLLFPALIPEGFGGEIVGCGERQNTVDEIRSSLARQEISAEPYEWYINLRNQPGYKTTSGFGLGIERFIAWILCRKDIRDVIAYPRLKNIRTYP
jgi:asparaginyl-tRNA synthetase